ncbi:hypothetical protein Tcan_14219 [Toxocara canis]|uniref:Ground-like domain-containing protein n=1 Tax=Toxocara canis TaxID=6265 RepID=A0A0B2VMZ3_TOXCA|nr:hypothetical protein Tcan_14219 [Toxocara canis]
MINYCITLLAIFAPAYVSACGCACPVCAPLPPPCPPPIVCPPMVCPPPIPCPPPMPAICPPIDPCMSGGMSPMSGGYSTGGGGYSTGGYSAGGGGYATGGYAARQRPSSGPSSGFAASARGGGYPGRARKLRSVIEQLSVPIIKANETTVDDPLCNSAELRRIMETTMSSDTTESKMAVQKAAENHFHKTFNVLCAKGDFAYFAYTETFCQITKADTTCYAF